MCFRNGVGKKGKGSTLTKIKRSRRLLSFYVHVGNPTHGLIHVFICVCCVCGANV